MRRIALYHLLFALLALVLVTAYPDQAQQAQAAFDAGQFDSDTAQSTDASEHVDEFAQGMLTVLVLS